MYSVVVRQSSTLETDPIIFQVAPVSIHSYYNIIDYISHAVLYIPVSLVYLLVLPNLFTFFTQPPPSPFSVAMSLFQFCLCILFYI